MLSRKDKARSSFKNIIVVEAFFLYAKKQINRLMRLTNLVLARVLIGHNVLDQDELKLYET